MYIALRKLYLRPENMKKRFQKAKEWMYIPKDHRRKVLWSDESPFERLNCPKISYVRRKQGNGIGKENLTGTIKHGGGKIMLWECFSYSGVGNKCESMGKWIVFNILRSVRKTWKNLSINWE